MPIELLTMLGSGVFGFISKMWANNAADNAAQHKMLLESHTANEKSVKSARRLQTPAANTMRRFIVIALFAMLALLLVGGFFGSTNILIETAGTNWFGLFTTGAGLDVLTVDGLVAYPWMHHAVLSIISFYFGTGVAKR